MSTEIDCYYGFGFGYDCIADKTDTIIQFLKNHIVTLRKLNYTKRLCDLLDINETDKEHYLESIDGFNCTFGWSTDFSGVIAEIMCYETGISFGSYTDTESNETKIMFDSAYPWSYNEKEKSLTYDKLESIVKVYLSELGIDNAAPSYQKVVAIG